VIADNRLALNAGWDNEMLTIELNELLADDFALDILGFDENELKALLDPIQATEGLTDEDAVPDAPKEPKTKPGDIWIMGRHRLMCGDGTSIDAVDKLMPNELADLVFTDPPYNVAYSGRGENNLGTIKNDDMTDAQFEDFCRAFFGCYFAKMKSLACIYVCHPDSQSAPKLAFEKTFAEQFKKSSTLIWMKQSAGMGWQDYRAQHEPILYGWKPGTGKHFYCGDRAKTTIWKIGRDAQSKYVHPTQKPVALPEEAINNSSKGQDIVLDLFGGSGSTLIACEKQHRYARLMELDPKYCDVIVKRWEEFTGKTAELAVKSEL
jgi:DNA modification methylase